MKKKLPLILCTLFAVTQLFAQTHPVSGRVTGKDDALPLPGVSVTVQGTNTGTQTDVDGKYSLNAANGAVLVFSFIGYQPQNLKVTVNVLNVALIPSRQQLG